jgi:PKD repeat protein
MGAAPTASVVETSKVAGNDGGLFGGNDEIPAFPIMRLTMRGSTGNWKDEATLIFDGGTEALESLDALKFEFNHPSAPRIATRTSDGHDVILNRLGAVSSNIAIPVTARVPANGTYSITVSLSGLQMLTCFTLEDLLTGTITPLTDGAVYTFTMNTTATVVANRFVLRSSVAYPYSASNALCGGTATGAIAVQVPEGPVDLTLADAFGNPVQVATNVPVGEYIFSGLVAGNYTVSAGSSSACGTLSAPVVVAEPFALEATTDAVATTCSSGSDGSVAVGVLGGEAPYTYLWSTGATEAGITGAAGTYTAVVTDASGCTLEVEAVIPSGPGPDALFGTDGEPILVGEPVTFVNLGTPDASSYAWDFGDGATSMDFDAVHTYELPGNYTVTLTVTDGDCASTYTEEVVVQLTTGAAEPGVTGVTVNAWAAGDQLIVEHNFDHGRAVYIEVLDATGRLYVQRQVGGTPGRVNIPASGFTTGIWFVRVTSGQDQYTLRVPVLR